MLEPPFLPLPAYMRLSPPSDRASSCITAGLERSLEAQRGSAGFRGGAVGVPWPRATAGPSSCWSSRTAFPREALAP